MQPSRQLLPVMAGQISLITDMSVHMACFISEAFQKHPEDSSGHAQEVLEALPMYSIICRYWYPCGFLGINPLWILRAKNIFLKCWCSEAFSAFLLAQKQEVLLVLHCYKSQFKREYTNWLHSYLFKNIPFWVLGKWRVVCFFTFCSLLDACKASFFSALFQQRRTWLLLSTSNSSEPITGCHISHPDERCQLYRDTFNRQENTTAIKKTWSFKNLSE